MSFWRFLAAIVVSSSLLLPASQARAAAFTVSSTIDAPDATPGDGICATAGGLCTLRAAIQESNASPAGDTITILPGTYALTIAGRGENLAATGDLDITQSVSIMGAGPGATVIDGAGGDRVFHVIGPITVQISGLAVRNGSVPRPADISADGGGGGIYSSAGARLTLVNVTVTGNSATSGAVLNDDGGVLTVVNTSIAGNTTGFGGAVFNNGTVTITNSTLTGNTAASSGGAIYNRIGSLILTNSTVSGNTASSTSVGGGGILNAAAATLSVASSLVASNTAVFNGGGVHNRGQLSLINSTLSSNTAHGSGGGLFAGGGTVVVSNVTVALNSVDANGGGIDNVGGAVSVRNSILAGSPRGGNCSGAVLSQGFNLDSGSTCGLSSPGDLIGVDPLLGSLGTNGGTTQTHPLLPGSAAIDGGSPSAPGSGGTACEATDQRGIPRPTDGNGDGVARCDIGAFEAPVSSAPAAIGLPVAAPPIPVAAPTALPIVTPAPVRSPTPVPVLVSPPPPPVVRGSTIAVTPASPPSQELDAPEPAWLLVPPGTPLYTIDGYFWGLTEEEEWYRVILTEDGWLLAAANPDWPVWLPDSLELSGG